MSNQLYPVLNSSGGEILPTSNATLTTESMAANPSQNAQVYIEFFSDALGTTPATPTAGTVTIQGSPMGLNWLAPSTGGTVQANTVGNPNSTYTPPFFQGRMAQGRITFAGVTGAAFARVTFWRY